MTRRGIVDPPSHSMTQQNLVQFLQDLLEALDSSL